MQGAAVRDVEDAKAAMGAWEDGVARLCVPTVLLPGGLDAMDAWVRCWRAVAYAAGAVGKIGDAGEVLAAGVGHGTAAAIRGGTAYVNA